MLVLQKSGCRSGEKCSYAHRQVYEEPSKRSKKNGDKSAVALLKKFDLRDRTEQPVVDRDTRHESNHGPVGCSSSNTRQLGCVFQDTEPRSVSHFFALFVFLTLFSVIERHQWKLCSSVLS